MEFFNKKEEVFEIILTQKGKELFSAGKFKPFFYSFHDTDITYDDNSTEEQNSIVPRIKDTPTLKQNTNIYQQPSTISSIPIDKQQLLYCEIGSKTLGDQYRPSWQLNFIKSPLFQYVGNRDNPDVTKNFLLKTSSSLDHNNCYQEFIPQVDIQFVYEIVQFSFQDTVETYFVKDSILVVGVDELNSFEANEQSEFDMEIYYYKYGAYNKLSFDENKNENVYKYFSILFDKYADFQEKAKVKDIYGNLVPKDESNC